MACRSPATKSSSSHLLGVVQSWATQAAFVPELAKAITFSLRFYPGEISHSNSPNLELSNNDGLCKSGEEKLQFTPFLGGPKPGCSDSLHAGIIESHNFFS